MNGCGAAALVFYYGLARWIMKKKLYLAAGFIVLAAAFPLSAEAAPRDPLAEEPSYTILQEGNRRSKQPWIYLDRSSVTIRDLDGEAFIVEVLILEVRERGKTYGHPVLYRLDGKEDQVKGIDGKWHVLPKNSDDPSAVAVVRIFEELRDPARHAEFADAIGQILLRKDAEKAAKEKAAAKDEDRTGVNAETAAPEAPRAAAVDEGAESLIMQRARESAETVSAAAPAAKEAEMPATGKAEEKTDGEGSGIIVSIERHEPAPAVEIEIISEKTETHDIVTSAGAETGE